MPRQICVCVTPAEYADVRERARKKGLNLTQFLRARLGLEVTAVRKPEPISLDKPTFVQ
jgi:hypothetical protein